MTVDGAQPADLGVRAGRIACMAMPGALPPSERMLDATGCLILPRLVDPHVRVDFTLQGAPVADVTEARNNWLFYRDRRPETYGDLAEPGP